MLHITNGDSTAISLRASGLPGIVVAWKDVLHEGPVPAGLSLEQLTAVRVDFLSASGWAPRAAVMADLSERDDTLRRFGDHEEVILWFEHDLYDQLQLIQILAWFAGQERGATALTLICINTFPGLEPFLGLGQLQPDQLAALFGTREPVTADHLSLARDAWEAFRSPDPHAIELLLAHQTAALPFLGAALRRHLEQFPAVTDGLSRTEREILTAAAAGARTPPELFREQQAMEESPYQGDLMVWESLRALANAPAPALALVAGGRFALPPTGANGRHDGHHDAPFAAQQLTLTPLGRALLDHQADWIRLNDIDRWLGGVHLQSPHTVWRWDTQREQLVRG